MQLDPLRSSETWIDPVIHRKTPPRCNAFHAKILKKMRWRIQSSHFFFMGDPKGR